MKMLEMTAFSYCLWRAWDFKGNRTYWKLYCSWKM